MEDLIESITRNNPTAVKVVLASVVVGLAFYQVALMAVGYGKIKLRFLKPQAASFTHRAVGDAVVVITVIVAIMCIGYFGFEDASGDDTRATLHIVFAILLLVTLALKIAVLRRFHELGNYLPALGLTAFVLFILTWITSAGDYLTRV